MISETTLLCSDLCKLFLFFFLVHCWRPLIQKLNSEYSHVCTQHAAKTVTV